MSVPYDALSAPLGGRWMIEASAGTGKTWTIAWLFVRFLVEREVDVEQILVVTYTEAAADELRDRLRKRVKEALDALDGRGEPRAVELAQDWAEFLGADAVRARLREALRGFDRAVITTIHGFCRRSLQDQAFESGQPFEMDLVAASRGWQDQVLRDVWSRVMRQAEPEWVAWASSGERARQVREVVRLALASRPLRWEPQGEVEVSAAVGAWRAARSLAREAWLAGGREVALRLGGDPSLNQTMYKPEQVGRAVAAVDAHFGGAGLRALDGRTCDRLRPEVVLSKVKKGAAAPAVSALEPLAALLQAGEGLLADFADAWPRLLFRVAREAQVRQVEARPTPGTVYFDDLLVRLRAALVGPGGPALADALRARHPVAFIDEFQDTDPVQYDIFQSIYPGEGDLALIGDPKQAIYRFRGADLPTYLRARAESPRRGTLVVNHRADAALLRSASWLFELAGQDALGEGVAWEPVSARHEGSALRGPPAWCRPLHLLHVPARGARDDAALAAAVAADVVACLSSGLRLEVDGQQRVVRPGDCAVLVDQNALGQAVQEALITRGVACIRRARSHVFASEHLPTLLTLLDAVLAPGDPRRLGSLLASDLFGHKAETIEALGRDEALLSGWLDTLAEWRTRWQERGLARMMQEVWSHGAMEQAAIRPGGERVLTDVRHLVELAAAREAELFLGPVALRRWLGQMGADPDGEASGDEAAELRLESDAAAVQVLTVHTSKGLEFPLVWCAALSRARADDRLVVYHRDGQTVVDLAGTDEGTQRSHDEVHAEGRRLAYVALTRARHLCVVAVGRFGQAWQGSALMELLQLELAEKADDDELYGRLAEVAAAGGILLRTGNPLDRRSWSPPTEERPVRELPVVRRRCGPDQRLTSFSALVRGADDGMEHDLDLPEAGEPELPLAAFPRGTGPGTAVHAVLEELDFADLGEMAVASASAILGRHGIDGGLWAGPLVDGLRDMLRAPVEADGFCLADLPRVDRVDEMGFSLGVGGSVDVRGLAEAVQRHGGPLADYAPWLRRFDVRLEEAVVQGFIDLVYRRSGRYYVVDYKTNHLGGRADDYAWPRLHAAMKQGDYVLQAVLYAVAVHRHLRQNLPGYRYERDFGGVRYLFLRGMQPGSDRGVYAFRPSEAWIDDWDHRLGGGS